MKDTIWALITGASSGLGAEYAKILSEKGYSLILVGRNLVNLKKIQTKMNTNSKIEICDLSKSEDAKSLCSKYADLFNLNLIVNCAGLGTFGKGTEIDIQHDLNVISVNIQATYLLTHFFLKLFLKRQKGRIINIASIAGVGSSPLMANYGASKAWVRSFSQSLDAEIRYLYKTLVRIVTISPGPLKTNFFNTMLENKMFNKSLNKKSDKIAFNLEKFAQISMKRALKTRKNEIVVGKLSKFLYGFQVPSKWIYHRIINKILLKNIKKEI